MARLDISPSVWASVLIGIIRCLWIKAEMNFDHTPEKIKTGQTLHAGGRAVLLLFICLQQCFSRLIVAEKEV